ncbi:histidine phosphatase family protein [Streptomyces sp. SCSIO 30461]|uniref:histidine phosphatase family protein n=1 Tax=Streptomyces sp. SCSIO 30461 TaxID=3118085 RepID=UPI0030CE32B6
MTIRLTLYATAGMATRDTVLGDGPLSGTLSATGLAGVAPQHHDAVVRAPSARCAQAAAALGLASDAVIEPVLRDIDYGTWSGRTVGDVAATDPHRLSAWLKDPDATPPGGESVRQLCRRTRAWLRRLEGSDGPDGLGGLRGPDRLSGQRGRVRERRRGGSCGSADAHTLVIAEPAVVRALLVDAMCVPVTAFWHLDVPVLSAVSLLSPSPERGGVWDVESKGAPVVRSRRPADTSDDRVGI